MSLRIWLPLTKDLRNQGLDDITITNSGATYSATGGKLGGCYVFDGSDDSIGIGNLSTLVNTDFTFACWFYHDNTWSSKGYETLLGGPSGFELESKVSTTNSPVLKLYNWGGGSCIYELNKWNHVVFTRNTTETKLYLNGELQVTGTAGTIPSGNYFIGAWKTSAQQNFKGNMNDVRIYDHCLSPMEVKKLAKGLVLHYPLNRGGFGPSNLLKNGFGELDRENWGNSNIYTDVPSGHSEIKKSYRDNESVEFIPLFRNCTYKFTGWIKAASTSGSSYPSLKPYDADKLFISTYNCREGFNLNTMTTLKQQLKAGDTKIYVNDLSAWNANSGHYYDVAAIFSYTDGQGYTWPDGIYTRNCPAFASSTEAKTNLDKTNNIITLLTAYTGPTMPAGTKVCASTYGSTYFYPWGGISNSSITDWTYKEGTFSSENVRMECAKYIRVYAYSTCYQAGMTLSNLTVDNLMANIEYDASGFCNNGEYYAYDTNGSISYISDTPKYSVSTHIASANPTQNTASGTRYLYGHCELTNPTQMSVAFWLKPITGGYGGTTSNGQGYFCTTNYEYGNTNVGSDYQASAMNHRDGAVNMNDSASTTQCNVTFYPTIGEWHHYVYTYDGQVGRGYKDGVQIATAQFSAAKTLDSFIGVVIGFSKAGGVWRKNDACYSDFRIYATALSADDVKSLYQNCATIDPDGTIRGQIRS